MSFGAPQWLEALLLAPALIALLVRNEMAREHLLKKLVAARLLPNLAASASAPRRRWKFVLAVLGLAFVILAMAQPRVGYDVVINHRLGMDLMIAVDTSKSMLSNDVQPDRLTRAKFAAQDLVNSLDGDRAGLIAFAGTSFVEAPLTVDYSAVINSIVALDTNTIPRGGTNIASAIRQAADAFGTGEGKSRALVLFTDGEELEDDAVQAAKDAAGKFRIYTVGVGTREGSLIPVPDSDGATQFVKDDQGQYVKSHLAEEKLKQIAEAAGGFYVHLESGPATAKTIIDLGLKKLQEHEFETRENLPIDRYQWPLGAGILLLIASVLIRERRPEQRLRAPRPPPVPRSIKSAKAAKAAKTAATVAVLLLATARGWSRNEGLNLYDAKNYKGAYDTFQGQLEHNPASDGLEFDSGASAYKEGDYDKALEDFGKVLGSTDPGLRGQAEYNLANTLVQRGALQREKDAKIKEWTDAINHYDQALKVDPKNGDAQYNRDVVKKMIDDLNKQEQQQKQQQQQNQQNQKNQQKQNQQNQNQQQQNQQQNQQNQGQQQNNQGQQQQNQNQQQNGQNQQQQQNQGGQQQQKQQQQGTGQNQQQQPQQQQGQNQQSQNQNSQQGQQNGQQQQQNGQQSQSGQDQQGNNQQAGQQQNGQQNQQPKPDQAGQDEQNQTAGDQNSMNGASPSPSPANGQAAAQQGQQGEEKAAAQGATEAGRPGEMTPSQAKALIDSLRGEEEHVSFEGKHDNNEAPYKDW